MKDGILAEHELPDAVIVSEGICMAIVCTRIDDREAIEALLPSPGTTHGWTVCTDEYMAARTDSGPWPQPCNEYPQQRRHILVEC